MKGQGTIWPAEAASATLVVMLLAGKIMSTQSVHICKQKSQKATAYILISIIGIVYQRTLTIESCFYCSPTSDLVVIPEVKAKSCLVNSERANV